MNAPLAASFGPGDEPPPWLSGGHVQGGKVPTHTHLNTCTHSCMHACTHTHTHTHTYSRGPCHGTRRQGTGQGIEKASHGLVEVGMVGRARARVAALAHTPAPPPRSMARTNPLPSPTSPPLLLLLLPIPMPLTHTHRCPHLRRESRATTRQRYTLTCLA
jgi:hypothetical protein